MIQEIQSIRADLAAWSAGKPRAVQQAVANLDGWLDAVLRGPDPEHPQVGIRTCTARAVETLRAAVHMHGLG